MITDYIWLFKEFSRKLFISRHMVWGMALRELKARYVGSAFGLSWAVLNPLSQVAIYGIVFGYLFKARPDPVYHTDSYFLYLICGLIPWLYFSQSVSSTTNSIVSNKSLVKKSVGFPSEVLPIVSVISNIISHLIGLMLLLIISFSFGMKPSLYLMLIALYIIIISVLSIGLGWFLSSLNVYIRDVKQVVGVVMTGWFFFTPIMWSPTLVPERFKVFLLINPMYHLVLGYRNAILGYSLLPAENLITFSIMASFAFVAGGMVFRKLKPGFAEVL